MRKLPAQRNGYNARVMCCGHWVLVWLAHSLDDGCMNVAVVCQLQLRQLQLRQLQLCLSGVYMAENPSSS